MDLVPYVHLLSQFVEVCKCKLHNHMYNVEYEHRHQAAAPVAAVAAHDDVA
jgi:hypothetical protein